MTITSFWIPLLGVFGVGGLIAALITRGVEVAKHRQALINFLRDDISEVLSRRRIWDAVDPKEQPECERCLRAAHARIALRLNMRESDHIELHHILE